MITLSGKNAVGNLLANGLGGYIAVGVGQSAPSAMDEGLDFEVHRAPIRSRSYDATTGILTFTATIPEHLSFFLSECAMVSSPLNATGGGFVVMFDPSTEEWSAGTWTGNNTRIGTSGLLLSAATAKTAGDTPVSLASTSLSDRIQVAYHGVAGGQLHVRLNNTDTDYYSATFTVGAGYKVESIAIHEMSTVGTVDISGINSVTVIHSGTGSVTLDAIKVTPSVGGEALVIRQVFSPGHQKVSGVPLDIEVPLQL